MRRSWGASADVLAVVLVVAVAVLLWLPRRSGPIDLRWDGAVYYILGTSLAQGHGYRLLNEPGHIEAVQYPPLLPAIVAACQRLLGTSDPTTVGRWLRLSSFLIFVVYAVVVLRFLRSFLPPHLSVLGTLLSLFCLHAWFLSDLLFPEIWFTVATLLFFMFARRRGSAPHAVMAYLTAVAAFALRTVGLAALAAWVLDSVWNRRFGQAALRAVLVLIPVASWQLYVASVERSPGYTEPAYEYQRAPYLFYNVSYARNIALRDPFAPEKGDAQPLRRIARNALELPMYIGETLSVSRRYLDMWLHGIVGDGPRARSIVRWATFTGLSLFGGVLAGGGLVILLWQGAPLVPLYMLAYLAALSLTPFPGQYPRYLMPLVPLAALCALVFLTRAPAWAWPASSRLRAALPFVVLGPALALQIVVTLRVFSHDAGRVTYLDKRGERLDYRLVFYDEAQRGFDEAVDYLRTHASPSQIVAAGTPHWIYLRTGLTAVMPPFEQDPAKAAALLAAVPVTYLVIGQDVVATERYTRPVVRQYPGEWQRVHTTAGGWEIYRRQQH